MASAGLRSTPIKQEEAGAIWSILGGREYNDAAATRHGTGSGTAIWLIWLDKDHYYNYTNVADQYIRERYDAAANLVDIHEQNKIFKELALYWFERASFMNLPVPNFFHFWQPWVHGYAGEWLVGSGWISYQSRLMYSRVDQDLKESMGY